jgi:hypothetical protein
MALLMSGFLDIWFLVASLGTWYFIERAGRRWLFMWTAAGMAIVMAIFAAMLEVNTFASGVVSAVMLFLYVALFTWGWMGGCWVSLYCDRPLCQDGTETICRSTRPKSFLSNIGPKVWDLPSGPNGYGTLSCWR